jgi:hypothetical protein
MQRLKRLGRSLFMTEKGFPQTDAYNINSAFAEADEDGSVTIHFGSDKSAKKLYENF